jgi:hypothetical protein
MVKYVNEITQCPSCFGREREKTCGYLLNPGHRFGASKARFFSSFGFRIESWIEFATALRNHGQTHQVAKVKDTGFGPRYEIDGELIAPDGRRPRVRTVWQVDKNQINPRLITAYPLEVL